MERLGLEEASARLVTYADDRDLAGEAKPKGTAHMRELMVN
jgi:hypothetical protein